MPGVLGGDGSPQDHLPVLPGPPRLLLLQAQAGPLPQLQGGLHGQGQRHGAARPGHPQQGESIEKSGHVVNFIS